MFAGNLWSRKQGWTRNFSLPLESLNGFWTFILLFPWTMMVLSYIRDAKFKWFGEEIFNILKDWLKEVSIQMLEFPLWWPKVELEAQLSFENFLQIMRDGNAWNMLFWNYIRNVWMVWIKTFWCKKRKRSFSHVKNDISDFWMSLTNFSKMLISWCRKIRLRSRQWHLKLETWALVL